MLIKENPFQKAGKWIIALLVTALIIYLSYFFFDIIIMLIISILIAMIFNPVVSALEKKNIPRLFSVLLVFIFSTIIVLAGFSILIPKIVNQMNTITETLNQDNVNSILSGIESFFQTYLPFINSTNLAVQVEDFLSALIIDSFANLSEILTSILSILAISVIVPFMTFFFLKDKNRILKGIIDMAPNRYFEMFYSVMKQISRELGRFVRGWILDAFIVGAMSAIGLMILGIDNAITIGFIAGVGHLIPYFGPIVGGLPAALISVIQFGDFSMLPAIIIMFLIVYTLDNGFIQPNVFSKSTDIHPLMIIILILIGSQVLGIFGMLIAVPTATVLRTAGREIFKGYKYYNIFRIQ